MLVHCGWGYTNGLSCYRKHYGESSKIKNRSTIDPAIPVMGIYPMEIKIRYQKYVLPYLLLH